MCPIQCGEPALGQLSPIQPAGGCLSRLSDLSSSELKLDFVATLLESVIPWSCFGVAKGIGAELLLVLTAGASLRWKRRGFVKPKYSMVYPTGWLGLISGA